MFTTHKLFSTVITFYKVTQITHFTHFHPYQVTDRAYAPLDLILRLKRWSTLFVYRQYRLQLRIKVLHALLTYRLVTIKDAPKNSVKDPIGFRSGFAYVVPVPRARVSTGYIEIDS
jgi:hypothetical protein